MAVHTWTSGKHQISIGSYLFQLTVDTFKGEIH